MWAGLRMVFGRPTTRHASSAALLIAATAAAACQKPLYLTFDTGHMGVAEHVAMVLKREQIRASFFLANEPTQPLSNKGSSLDSSWAAWWKARAAEGHLMGSHTWDHLIFTREIQRDGKRLFEFKYNLRNQPKGRVALSEAQYCEQLRKPAQWFEAQTGQAMQPIFRAPGGSTSPGLLAAAKRCGYAHVGWPKSGWSRDELPSEQVSNAALLGASLREIKSGDIILAHLGIWSRREAWAHGVLEPLLQGLKARGFCFKTLQAHPEWPIFETVQHLRGY